MINHAMKSNEEFQIPRRACFSSMGLVPSSQMPHFTPTAPYTFQSHQHPKSPGLPSSSSLSISAKTRVQRSTKSSLRKHFRGSYSVMQESLQRISSHPSLLNKMFTRQKPGLRKEVSISLQWEGFFPPSVEGRNGISGEEIIRARTRNYESACPIKTFIQVGVTPKYPTSRGCGVVRTKGPQESGMTEQDRDIRSPSGSSGSVFVLF